MRALIAVLFALLSFPAWASSPVGWLSAGQAALSSTVTAVKASAGQLGTVLCYNPNTSAVYIQLFDATTANVNVGTTAPKFSIGIASSSEGGFALTGGDFTSGIGGVQFLTAISLAATTTATGSTGPSTAVTCAEFYL